MSGFWGLFVFWLLVFLEMSGADASASEFGFLTALRFYGKEKRSLVLGISRAGGTIVWAVHPKAKS